MNACPKPAGKAFLVDHARGNVEHGQSRFSLRCDQTLAVQPEKQADRKKRGALVAVDKSVVLRKSHAVDRCEIRQIRLTVGDQVQRPRQRGLKQAFIPDSWRTAMLGKAFIVQQNE